MAEAFQTSNFRESTVRPLWLTNGPVSANRIGRVVDGKVVYVTHIQFSASPFPSSFPEPKQMTISAVQQLGIACASDLVSYLDRLSLIDGIQADWDSWQHNNESRQGSVNIRLGRDPEEAIVSQVSWSYESLDDPDEAEYLPMPVDFRTEVIGALTPAQQEKFWDCVNQELEPFQVLDAVLERFGLTPTEHDAADQVTLRTVLALEWYRNFDSLEAAEQVLDLGPNLTDTVLGQLALMASRCGLEGDAYELFEIFVTEIA